MIKNKTKGSLTLAMAVLAQYTLAQSEVVAPPLLSSREPFTFTARGIVEGEVIYIQTVSGEVVEAKKPDRLGRVFLQSGLAAGAYYVSTKLGGRDKTITVASQSSAILQGPKVIEVGSRLSLPAKELDPESATIKLQRGNVTSDLPVLAASRSCVVAQAPNATPGRCVLTVYDVNGPKSESFSSTLYELKSTLVHSKIASGQRTDLITKVSPSSLNLNLHATILDGPVTFLNGQKQMDSRTEDGEATFPIRSVGSPGKFQVAVQATDANPVTPVSDDSGHGATKVTEKIKKTSGGGITIEVRDEDGRLIEVKHKNPAGDVTVSKTITYWGDSKAKKNEVTRTPRDTGGWTVRRVKRDEDGRIMIDEEVIEVDGVKKSGKRTITEYTGSSKTGKTSEQTLGDDGEWHDRE